MKTFVIKSLGIQSKNVPLLTLWALLLAILGCGSGGGAVYPVHGKVFFSDNSPLTTGGQIIFESINGSEASQHAMGTIASDGSFVVKMAERNGVLPGRYRCKLRGTSDTSRSTMENHLPAVAIIHPRYEKYSTSGLEFEVKPEKNFFEIKVEPPR